MEKTLLPHEQRITGFRMTRHTEAFSSTNSKQSKRVDPLIIQSVSEDLLDLPSFSSGLSTTTEVTLAEMVPTPFSTSGESFFPVLGTKRRGKAARTSA